MNRIHARIRPQRLPITPQKPLPAKHNERYNFVETIFQEKNAATRNRIRFAIDLPLPPHHHNKTAGHGYPPYSLQVRVARMIQDIFPFAIYFFKILTAGATVDPLDKKPRRNYDSRQPTGILCAEPPSSQEFAIPITMGAPTKFREPTPRLHPHRRIDFHRSAEISFRIAILPATIPTVRPHADPAMAPAQFRAVPESAPASARSWCRTCTPRQKTTILGRAAPSHPCTHLPPTSSPFILPPSSYSNPPMSPPSH